MKKILLMSAVLLGTTSISLPAHAIYCSRYNTSQDCQDQREQEARTEYMKQEAELMKQRARMLEKCHHVDPPSYCK